MNLWHLADKLLERSTEERAEVTIQIDERQSETRVAARIRLSWRDETMPHNMNLRSARKGAAQRRRHD